MKRSGSAVKFAEPAESAEDGNASPSMKFKGMRYGRILQNLAGGGSSSSSQAEQQASEGPRKVFNPAAAPAKPAMKSSRSGGDLAAGAPLYPAVDKDGNPILGAAAEAPNPATGLVGYQTRGGAALASALGVQDGTIPPTCPPALPHTTVIRPDASSSSSASPDALTKVTGPVSNPLAVPDMPLMAPVAPAGKHAGAAADLQAAMPAAALADGTVQLSTAGSYDATAKRASLDAGAAAGGLQHRDQQQAKSSGDWQRPAAAAGSGWQSAPGGVSGDVHSKDIETAVHSFDSPTAGGGKGADFDDDASRWVMAPAGSSCTFCSS